MFEVPRAFGAFEKLLTDLGAMEKPLVSDYLEFLKQLKKETGNFPLNPNELNAVVKVITLIIQSSSTYHSESTGSNHSKLETQFIMVYLCHLCPTNREDLCHVHLVLTETTQHCYIELMSQK